MARGAIGVIIDCFSFPDPDVHGFGIVTGGSALEPGVVTPMEEGQMNFVAIKGWLVPSFCTGRGVKKLRAFSNMTEVVSDLLGPL